MRVVTLLQLRFVIAAVAGIHHMDIRFGDVAIVSERWGWLKKTDGVCSYPYLELDQLAIYEDDDVVQPLFIFAVTALVRDVPESYGVSFDVLVHHRRITIPRRSSQKQTHLLLRSDLDLAPRSPWPAIIIPVSLGSSNRP